MSDTRPAVIPRIFTREPRRVTAFMREVLGATGDDQESQPTEMSIDGSIVMVSDGGGVREPMAVCAYVRVADVRAAFARALALGASEVDPVRSMFWGDDVATVRDPAGNLWQIATPTAGRSAAE